MSIMSSYRFCPICDKMQSVMLCEDETETEVAKTKVRYNEIHYRCPVTNETFMDTNLINQNILRARNAYIEVKGTA